MKEEYQIPDDVKVLCATPNYTNTYDALAHLNHVECFGAWQRQGIDFNHTVVGRSFVHFARTQMCQVAVEGGFTHLFWLDDDAIIDPMILPRFIAHDKDVVIAPYPMRKMPHEIGVLKSTNGDFHDHDSYKNLKVADMDQGLIQIDGGGTHCMLVKVEVFKRQGESTDEMVLPPQLYDAFEKLTKQEAMLAKQFLGEAPKGNQSFQEEDKSGLPYFVMPKSGTEDMYWCYRAKRKGIEIWCDTDVFADHVGFAPRITRAWCEYAEEAMKKAPEGQHTHMHIVPGDTDQRNHYAVVRDKATNLV